MNPQAFTSAASAWLVSVELALTACLTATADAPRLLSYAAPAGEKAWASHALPLGNGRLGCMIFGDPYAEHLQFNVDSLWTGDENPSGDYNTMGAYQAFGDVRISQDAPAAKSAEAVASDKPSPPPEGYRRTLDIATGLHTVSFVSGGITYTRTTFASQPDQVIVMRLTADKPAAFTGTVKLAGAHRETAVGDANDLTFEGRFPNGLDYAARVRVAAEGGTVTTANGVCRFDRCAALTLTLAAATSYAPDYGKKWKGAMPALSVRDQVVRACAKPYAALRQAHLADIAAFMDRVSLDLGTTAAARRDLPTDQRLAAYAQGAADPARAGGYTGETESRLVAAIVGGSIVYQP